MKLRKILSFCLVLLTVFFVGAQGVSAADTSLAFKKGEMLNQKEIIPGVKWENFKATSVTDEGTPGNQIVNFASIAPGAAQIIGYGIPSATGIKPSTVLEAAAHYEKTHPGMQVIAAINNDYFGSDSNGIFSMRNAAVIDNVVFREKSMYNQMYSIAVGENNEYKLTAPGGQLEISENYFLDIYDETGTNVIKTVELLKDFNVAPGAGQTSVIYKKAIAANGFEIFELTTTSNSKIDTVYYIAGNSKASVETSNANAVSVATADLEIANLIASGANIRIYKTLAGDWAKYDNVIGCPAQTLKDGIVLTPEEIKDYGYDHVTLRHPRTSIGFKEDGTMIIMVIDGRQSSDGMDGVSERENALCLKQEGCVSAFNFDGGGSSTFAILKDGVLTVTNSPSDSGVTRSDANHLLVVAPRFDIEYEIEEVGTTADGLVEVKGAATIDGLNGHQLVSAEVLVDGVTTGQSYEDFNLELLPNKEYNLSFKLVYKYYGKNYTKVIGNKTIKTSGESLDPSAPVAGKVKFSLNNLGFVVNIEFDDPHKVVNEVTISYDGKTFNAKRNAEGFFYNVISKAEKTYEFVIKYSYRLEVGTVVEETMKTITYTYGEETPSHEHQECPECGKCLDPECEGEKCLGHEVKPVHEHTVCPECGKCTASDCDGEKADKCAGHKTTGGSSAMNCNFGGLFVSSLIASFALLVIVFKRK